MAELFKCGGGSSSAGGCLRYMFAMLAFLQAECNQPSFRSSKGGGSKRGLVAQSVDCALGPGVGASDCTDACGTVTQTISVVALGGGSECDTPNEYECQPGDGACPDWCEQQRDTDDVIYVLGVMDEFKHQACEWDCNNISLADLIGAKQNAEDDGYLELDRFEYEDSNTTEVLETMKDSCRRKQRKAFRKCEKEEYPKCDWCFRERWTDTVVYVLQAEQEKKWEARGWDCDSISSDDLNGAKTRAQSDIDMDPENPLDDMDLLDIDTMKASCKRKKQKANQKCGHIFEQENCADPSSWASGWSDGINPVLDDNEEAIGNWFYGKACFNAVVPLPEWGALIGGDDVDLYTTSTTAGERFFFWTPENSSQDIFNGPTNPPPREYLAECHSICEAVANTYTDANITCADFDWKGRCSCGHLNSSDLDSSDYGQCFRSKTDIKQVTPIGATAGGS